MTPVVKHLSAFSTGLCICLSFLTGTSWGVDTPVNIPTNNNPTRATTMPQNRPLSEHDRLLKEAHDYWSTGVKRHREESIRLWQRYIDKYPDSPFLAEIYSIISGLYSCNINTNLGEDIDIPQMDKYLTLAKHQYGNKLDSEALCNWASFKNMPTATLKDNKEYYDRLWKIYTNGTPDDIWGIEDIHAYLKGNPLHRSDETKQTILDNLKENFSNYLYVAEANILETYWQSKTNLEDLARSYPNTELGKRARERLRQHDQQLLVDSYIEAADPVKHPDPQNLPPPIAPLKPAPTKMEVVARSSWRKGLLAGGVVCVIAGVGVLLFSRRRTNTKTPSL